MTSPTLQPQAAPASAASKRTLHPAVVPFFLFCVTALSTTSVGMRYMYNFKLGLPPLSSDADVLPFDWVFQHFSGIASGLPFSVTLIGILLAHEFGHYIACRKFKVACTLPYLLPAPSLSGSFGAVIRLKSRVRSRAALIVIGAMGPIAGFIVALFTVSLGLRLSLGSAAPIMEHVRAPLLFPLLHALVDPARPMHMLVPHPVLIASWMGLLITALNLIPAGQLDGGHILYALSPAAYRISHRCVIAGLFLLGIFAWLGWILWAIILTLPAMRHPLVVDTGDVKQWHLALAPICLVILVLSATFQPFTGFSLIDVIRVLAHR